MRRKYFTPLTPEEVDELPVEPWALGMEARDIMFVREFLVDLNATRAAVDSNYYQTADPVGCARANSWRILRRPVILKAIAAAMEERAKTLKISAQMVLGECWRCYLECVGERNWKEARGFLELAGRHVDVRAFREKFGKPDVMGEDDEEGEETGLSNLSLEELETLARLSRKAAGIDEAESASPLRH